MLNSIRDVGLFMIAAQMAAHFAPGKQYEKYIRSVSAIIILLLFLKPFLQFFGADWEEPEAVLERMEDFADMSGFQWGYDSPAGTGSMDSLVWNDVNSVVVRRMEAEVKELLNREMAGEDHQVEQVTLLLEKDPLQETEMILAGVKIVMTEKEEEQEAAAEETEAAADAGKKIVIERVVIGDTQENGSSAAEEDILAAYRQRIAALLEIEEEKVEVRQDGRG